MLITLVLAYSLSFNPALPAEERASSKKITLTVLDFESHDCPPSMARAVTDMVTGKLFSCDQFILLERSRSDLLDIEKRIARRKKGGDRSKNGARGMLSAEKIVMGSVSNFGYYRIEVKIINADDGKIDLSSPGRAENEKELDETVESIVDHIRNYYEGNSSISGKFDFSASAEYLAPMGELRSGTSNGYGGRILWYLNKPPLPVSPLILSAGFFQFRPSQRSLSSLSMVPIEIHFGRAIKVNGNINVIPSLGAGYIISRAEFDEIEERTYEQNSYTTKYYYNPVVSLRCESSVKLAHRWFIVCTPSGSVFFEDSRIGRFLALSVGFKMLF
jgi:hypothetical protein